MTIPTPSSTTYSSLKPMSSISSLPPLARSLSELPQPTSTVRKWRILLLVSAINSLTQRVATYLADLGFENVSIELALSDADMFGAVIAHSPHVILCPFLVKKVPDQIFQNVITLIVHPGPPGDAGPAALDWAILGDRGTEDDSDTALTQLLQPFDLSLPLSHQQRTHWGITVLQADETLDGGPVWAYDQFPLPDVSTVTKSYLYQNQVSNSVLRAVTVALCRIGASFETHCDPTNRVTWMRVRADPRWAKECVSFGSPFMGGKLHERPQIKPNQRRPNLASHSAKDVARIINCGDSQPGGTIPTTKSFLFVYDAHVHMDASDFPSDIKQRFETVSPGEVVAVREGAVLFKTATETSKLGGVAVWLTHGRVPKAANSGALNPKIPMAEALVAAGEGARLEGAPEWSLQEFGEKKGTWQQVFVRTITQGDKLIQLIYWDFYNGAFSTTGCKLLLRALQWAVDPSRGNVAVIALMGGQYFSNGVALNIIEAAPHPGHETWANINAIDDVVEFLAGDLSTRERSAHIFPLSSSTPSLTERGILSVACIRGNAAAGGVALAAACDVVIAGNTVVLNPAYRAMGLHGSEFHLYSYVERCGRTIATHLVRDMLPLSAGHARDIGLVDMVVGAKDASKEEVDNAIVSILIKLASTEVEGEFFNQTWFTAAPWVREVQSSSRLEKQSLISHLCTNKIIRYSSSSHIPLLHYRNEELSQMLLDSFHPIRSERYHSRRIKFVRKVKATTTASRFVKHRLDVKPDPEEMVEFDDAPGWVRGEEWAWVGMEMPNSMKESYSEGLRIDFGAEVGPMPCRRRSAAQSHRSRSTDNSSLHTAQDDDDHQHHHHHHEIQGTDQDEPLLISSVSSTAINGKPLTATPASNSEGFFTSSKLRPKSKKRDVSPTPMSTPARSSTMIATVTRTNTNNNNSTSLPPSFQLAPPVTAPKSLHRLSSDPQIPSPDAPRASLQMDNRRPSTSAGANDTGSVHRLGIRRSSRNASGSVLPLFSDAPEVPTIPKKYANNTYNTNPTNNAQGNHQNTGPTPTPGPFATFARLLKQGKREKRTNNGNPTTTPTKTSNIQRAKNPMNEVNFTGPAATYDRPVIPNEGDTESPCLYNVPQDFHTFPTALEKNDIPIMNV